MRTQSVKNLVSAFSMMVVLAAAAPTAFARPAQPRERDGVVKTMRLIIQRLMGGIQANGLPSTPIPSGSKTSTPPAANGLPSTPIPATWGS
jgi:hypothetical protein